MLISTRGRYALRFMIDLAEHAGEGAITLRAVSGRQDISVKYLEQIVTVLNRAGLIRSQRGNQGGYMLTRPAEQYTAGEILRTVEGTLSPVTCIEQGPESCSRYPICRTVHFWEGLDKVIGEYTNSVTLADLASEGTAFEGGDWCI